MHVENYDSKYHIVLCTIPHVNKIKILTLNDLDLMFVVLSPSTKLTASIRLDLPAKQGQCHSNSKVNML